MASFKQPTEGDRLIQVSDNNNIRSDDFNSNNNDLFNKAVNAVAAGLAYTAKRYMEIDNQAMPNQNKTRGTFAYDNSQSVFYTS